MRGPTRNDKSAEAQEHPVKGEIPPLADKVDEGERNREIRSCNQSIGCHVEPNQAGVPQIAIPMRHETIRGEKLLQKFHANLPSRYRLQPGRELITNPEWRKVRSRNRHRTRGFAHEFV